jgi:hypothetical protein
MFGNDAQQCGTYFCFVEITEDILPHLFSDVLPACLYYNGIPVVLSSDSISNMTRGDNASELSKPYSFDFHSITKLLMHY